MNPRIAVDLRAGTFRATLRYDLVLFDRLPAAAQALLRELEAEPDFYGVLQPKEEGLSIKSVTREVALLFLTMRVAGRLPAYFYGLFADGAEATAARLVLDGVLEVELNGEFVSGPRALHPADPAAERSEGSSCNALSLRALEYAEGLEINEPMKLSVRLYFFNRAPLTPQWRRRLPGEREVLDFVRSRASARALRRLDRYAVVPPGPTNDGWTMWRRPGESIRLGFKLYVSPMAEALPEAFATAIDVLTQRRVERFKVGRDLHGVLRPDKFVAYFATADELMTVADAIGNRLGSVPAQGVPFTAELGFGGLLSWGMDPPRGEQTLSFHDRPSWRLWLTHRLAAAILLARSQGPAALKPREFALERVRLDGVDPNTWMPRQSLWTSRASGVAV